MCRAGEGTWMSEGGKSLGSESASQFPENRFGERLGGACTWLILKLSFHSMMTVTAMEVARLTRQLHQLPRMLAKSFVLTSVDSRQGTLSRVP